VTVLATAALLAERDRAFAAVGTILGIERWPPVPLEWNRRLKRAGRAVVEGRRPAGLRARIELSPAYFEVYPDDLYPILVHEAVHVGLAVVGKPFGHSPLFRAACLAAGGNLHGRAMPGRVFRYRCPVCVATLERRRRPGGDRWCARCAEKATTEGASAFTTARALVLIGIGYRAAESLVPA
jgi:predicted SprT family Zn-dependent metalloprotease